MSKAIEDLRHEHEAILSALKILDRIVDDMGKGATPERRDLSGFLGFLKEFADKCHHGKEEGTLFPAMVKAGVAENGGPIGAMLAEHEAGRALVRKMEEALGKGPDYTEFARSAKQYSQLLKGHIAKENDVLFPMAEARLGTSSLEQLYQLFEDHEEKVIGHGRHEELHQMLNDLKTRYLK